MDKYRKRREHFTLDLIYWSVQIVELLFAIYIIDFLFQLGSTVRRRSTMLLIKTLLSSFCSCVRQLLILWSLLTKAYLVSYIGLVTVLYTSEKK